ncbi:MAG: pentapeptide repeat-containing protein [Deltaproteobacteria bacterium]|nr:pentapeptide repeat-containing protein [Deltaproteobacteria bacterium]
MRRSDTGSVLDVESCISLLVAGLRGGVVSVSGAVDLYAKRPKGILIRRSADLSDTNLNGANLTGANLSKVVLIQSNLKNAKLSNCRIYGISA